MAPEIFLSNYAPEKYTALSDIWAVGVTMYIIFSGCYPFDGASIDEFSYDVTKREKIEFDKDEGWGNVS
jgi:serine/threonine protein kinase